MIRGAKALTGCVIALHVALVHGEVVAVVSVRSPVAAMTRNQVVDVFLGKVVRFPDGTIAQPIDQAEGSAAREEFYLTFAGKSPAQLNAHWARLNFTGRGQPPPQVANGTQVKRRLAAAPNGIGYIDVAQLDDSVRVVVLER